MLHGIGKMLRELPLDTAARRAFTGICAVGAVVASFIFITDLALQTGWPPYAAPLLPLCIDALGAMALMRYRTTRDPVAARVAIGAITFSALTNAASHWYSAGLLAGNQWFSAGMLTPSFVLVTIVGTVPAISLGICVHLTTRGATWTAISPSVDQPASDPIPAPPPDTGTGGGSGSAASGSATRTSRSTSNGGRARTASAPAKSQTSRIRRSEHDLARQILDHNWTWDHSGDQLARLLQVSKNDALAARKLARAMASSPSSPASGQTPVTVGATIDNGSRPVSGS